LSPVDAASSKDLLDQAQCVVRQPREFKFVKEPDPHWLQAGLRGELFFAQPSFRAGRGAQCMLLKLVLVQPPGSTHLLFGRSNLSGYLGSVDRPVVADAIGGGADGID
jgi:hypothetical protein